MLGLGNAARIRAAAFMMNLTSQKRICSDRVVQRHEYQRHSDVHSALCLAEIRRARVVVDLYFYLVDPRKRVHYYHVLFRKLHFLAGQNVNALLLLVLFPACEALLLDTRHVEHVALADCFLNGGSLLELAAAGMEHILDVLRKRQGRR